MSGGKCPDTNEIYWKLFCVWILLMTTWFRWFITKQNININWRFHWRLSVSRDLKFFQSILSCIPLIFIINAKVFMLNHAIMVIPSSLCTWTVRIQTNTELYVETSAPRELSHTLSYTKYRLWEDKTLRARTGHQPSHAEANQLKWLTFHTHGCFGTNSSGCSVYSASMSNS